MEISIALCTYNGEKFLREQLESIAGQTLLPSELVVRDDRSTDATVQIVKSFAKEAPFPVRLEINPENLGSNRNFGRAIADCKGDVIALSDQDDVWHPQKLARLAAVLGEQPSVGLVFSDAALVDEELHPLGRRLWECIPFSKSARVRVRSHRAFSVLMNTSLVTGATAAFRAEYTDLVQAVPQNIPIGHDGWIALIIAALADLDFIDEPLIDYRQHRNQQIGAPLNDISRSAGAPGCALAKAGKKELYARRLHLHDCLQSTLAVAEEKRRSPRLQNALAETQGCGRHIKARAEMPTSRLSRLPIVWRELRSGRYAHYSRGLRSAMADLLT